MPSFLRTSSRVLMVSLRNSEPHRPGDARKQARPKAEEQVHQQVRLVWKTGNVGAIDD